MAERSWTTAGALVQGVYRQWVYTGALSAGDHLALSELPAVCWLAGLTVACTTPGSCTRVDPALHVATAAADGTERWVGDWGSATPQPDWNSGAPDVLLHPLAGVLYLLPGADAAVTAVRIVLTLRVG